MKTIIAGSRDITADLDTVIAMIESSGFAVTEVVSGTARGGDQLGELYAAHRGLPITQFPAQWSIYGKAAGIKRNLQMAAYGEALIALWDGKSPGTRHMIRTMRERGVPVHVVHVYTEATRPVPGLVR